MTAVSPPVDAAGTTTAPAGPPAAAAPARAAAVLAVLVALLGAVLGPTGQFDGLLGSRVSVAAGTVEVRDGDAWAPVPAGRALRTGSVVRAPDGTATLDVPGGAVDLAEGTRLVVGDPLVVQAGSLVARSDVVAAGDGVVNAVGEGPWRFDATGRVGAYGGAPVLTDAAGRETLVRSYQEARVADGVVQGSARPYVYVGSDPFDRQHLAAALDVDEYVATLRRGLGVDYGTAPQPPGFYTDFVGFDAALVTALEDIGFQRAGDRVGPPADVLVAAVMTDALVTDAGLSAEEASDEVRTKRLAGATWGLIAQARDLDAANVRAAADRALTLRQQAEDEGTATPAVAPQPDEPPAPATEGEGGAAPDTAGPDTPTQPDDGTGGEPAPDDGDGGDEDGLVGGVVDETGATDVLPEPLDQTVEDTVDVVDDVLEPVTGSSGSSTDKDDESLVGTTGTLVGETADAVGDTVGGLLGGGG